MHGFISTYAPSKHIKYMSCLSSLLWLGPRLGCWSCKFQRRMLWVCKQTRGFGVIVTAEHSDSTRKLGGHLEACHSCCSLQIFAEKISSKGSRELRVWRLGGSVLEGQRALRKQGKTSACKNNTIIDVIHLLLSILLHFWARFKVSFLYDSSHV